MKPELENKNPEQENEHADKRNLKLLISAF